MGKESLNAWNTEHRCSVCDQLCKFCEADFLHWTYWVREYVGSADIHRYVTSFGGSKISDVMFKPRMVSRFVWPNSKPTCVVILLKRSLIIDHIQGSDIELILSEEFIDKHFINRGFGNGLPSGHDVLWFPSVYGPPDRADDIKCEELCCIFYDLAWRRVSMNDILFGTVCSTNHYIGTLSHIRTWQWMQHEYFYYSLSFILYVGSHLFAFISNS
jgi:hypothetical protein